MLGASDTAGTRGAGVCPPVRRKSSRETALGGGGGREGVADGRGVGESETGRGRLLGRVDGEGEGGVWCGVGEDDGAAVAATGSGEGRMG